VRNIHKLEPLNLIMLFTRKSHKSKGGKETHTRARIATMIRTQVKKRAHKNSAISSQHN
jgi:hypothetical protein